MKKTRIRKQPPIFVEELVDLATACMTLADRIEKQTEMYKRYKRNKSTFDGEEDRIQKNRERRDPR